MLAALGDGPLGVTEVADRVRLPKSTVARLLSALQAEGAVEQVSTDARYRLGPRIVALAANVVPTYSLTAVAHPDLVGLAAAIGEAAGLSVPDGWNVHYVDQVSVAHEVQVRDWTGTRVPMHAVSSGQVFLAHLPPATLERFLHRTLERFTPRTLTDEAVLRDRLRSVQLDGYAWVREEFAAGIELGRGRDRRAGWRAGRGRPRPRTLVSVPGARVGGRDRPARRRVGGADLGPAAPVGGDRSGLTDSTGDRLVRFTLRRASAPAILSRTQHRRPNLRGMSTDDAGVAGHPGSRDRAESFHRRRMDCLRVR